MKNDDAVYTEQYKGLTINVIPDDNADDPREWGSLFGTMTFFHRRCSLGTPEKEAERHFTDPDEFNEFLEEQGDNVIKLPVYMYDHGQQTISTHPFSCPWDSGQLGYIWITKGKALEEFAARKNGTVGRKFTAKILKRTLDTLDATIKTMDQWMTGDVYGWSVEDEDGNVLESCWGYWGFDGEDKKYVLQEARNSADHELKKIAKQAEEERLIARMH
jgi:hypothetical protein